MLSKLTGEQNNKNLNVTNIKTYAKAASSDLINLVQHVVNNSLLKHKSNERMKASVCHCQDKTGHVPNFLKIIDFQVFTFSCTAK